MIIILTARKVKLALFVLIASASLAALGLHCCLSWANQEVVINGELSEVIHLHFDTRNKAVLEEDLATLKSLFHTGKRNGIWAYEHEVIKAKYLRKWSEKQGVRFTGIKSSVKVRRIDSKEDELSANLAVSTEYKYVYQDEPDITTSFRIGTYHSMRMAKSDSGWLVTRQWYTDPFADSLQLDEIKTESAKAYILSQEARDFSDLNKRRVDAVEYADRYCGAANKIEDGFTYNKKYRNYNGIGGDCANFASQILHEGGKFRKTYGWNYNKGGSSAWVNASAFKNYMLYSGRASLISYGNYHKVLKPSYKLLPGDFVAYEKKGDITHISVVTGADSKGYTLVNCHNTDRYRVPWDLGWSNKGIRFWLVRVHY